MEDLTEWLELGPIEGEYQHFVIDINEAADNVPSFPPRESVLALTAGIEPHQLPAAVVGLTVLVITDPVPSLRGEGQQQTRLTTYPS